jgi:tetratricopeptide (TPR) repeat protein
LKPLADAARALAEPLGDARTLAYVRLHEGDLAISRGEAIQAKTLLDEALVQFADIDDLWGVIVCLTGLGIAAQDRGEPALAAAYFERVAAIDSGRRLPAHYRAHTLANLAYVYRQLGREVEAFATTHEALRLAREAGRTTLIAVAQCDLARLYFDRGDIAQAALLVRESLAALWESGSAWDLTPTIELAAMVLAAGGKSELAARLLAAASELREAMPYPVGAGEQPILTRCLTDVRASLGEVQFSRAWHVGRTSPLEATVGEANAWLATLAG